MSHALPDDVRIRAARAGDLDRLPAIEIAAAAQFRTLGLSGDWLDEPRPAAELAAACREGRLWVALVDGRCVGFVLARRLDADEAWLEELDVHPDHGRRGLGRALVSTVVEWATRQGALTLALSTFRDVPWNAPFYARLGFREAARDDLRGPEREIVEHERRAGLPVERRVVMRLALEEGRGRRGRPDDPSPGPAGPTGGRRRLGSPVPLC